MSSSIVQAHTRPKTPWDEVIERNLAILSDAENQSFEMIKIETSPWLGKHFAERMPRMPIIEASKMESQACSVH